MTPVDEGTRFGLADIQRARGLLASHLARSPLERSPVLSRELEADVYLKLETVHPTRSFKVRGALNKIASLRANPTLRARGVVAASAGSHAQGVAFAAWRIGMPATVVMPRGVSETIVNVCRAYGAKVVLEGEVYDDTLAAAHDIEARGGKTFIHPYADRSIVAGQGTIGLEILDELPEADVVVVPVGGGGLISGIAAAVKESGAKAAVHGVEPEEADAVGRSVAAGRIVSLPRPRSIADKLVTKSTDPLNLALIRRYVDGMVTVADDAIADAMFVYLERLSLLVEGAGAASLAAARAGAVDVRGKKVVLVVSGGNTPATLVARIVEEHAAAAARG